MEKQSNRCCQECGIRVDHLPTIVEFEEQEIFLFDPVVCKKCLLDLCDDYSVRCENCGGSIPPYSQVGVLKGECGKREFVHMNTSCSTVGSAFYGYLGKGNLHQFIEIEAC
ncbi:hypothetical protein MNBD_NITROSPINAE05-435 [hydrothermal vent metagenome]|uniref:Uncharacterized protein n=1 Tax=hydrothermal vent metagenome TaxID=652676 RepID=A0A3B1DK73_9ZZZZ